MKFENTRQFATELDSADALKSFRDQFYIPKVNGEPAIYFTGNSLGLQPKRAQEALQVELDDWRDLGVEGHFHGRNPWYSYHERFAAQTAELMGAKPNEVVLMNSLTTNLHLLMVSFYRPKGRRTKIICEQKAFPSDQYTLETQVAHHGLDPALEIVEVGPREHEHHIRTEDFVNAIERHREELALVMIGGVNYYTGQWMDMETITKAGRETGAKVGWDLAHAAGNVPLKLHDWEVDFACWCSYKYLNSGPGAISGAFIHERNSSDTSLHRFAGWWGHNKEERFEMKPGFDPIPTAEGWQLSNAPVFNMAIHKVVLDIFEEAGMDKLRTKGVLLNKYLRFVVEEAGKVKDDVRFEIITPAEEKAHGCQLSVLTHGAGKSLFDKKNYGKKKICGNWCRQIWFCHCS